jgi:hypothetical protein
MMRVNFSDKSALMPSHPAGNFRIGLNLLLAGCKSSASAQSAIWLKVGYFSAKVVFFAA